jgi:hypothetical protein
MVLSLVVVVVAAVMVTVITPPVATVPVPGPTIATRRPRRWGRGKRLGRGLASS